MPEMLKDGGRLISLSNPFAPMASVRQIFALIKALLSVGCEHPFS